MTEEAEVPSQALMPWEGGSQGFLSTLKDGKAALIAIGEALSVDELKEHPAKIVHVIVHAATVVDPETGDETPVRRTVLVEKNGRSYACVSEGVISSLQQISAVLGSPPWPDGLLLKCIEKSTRGGSRRVKRLIPA